MKRKLKFQAQAHSFDMTLNDSRYGVTVVNLKLALRSGGFLSFEGMSEKDLRPILRAVRGNMYTDIKVEFEVEDPGPQTKDKALSAHVQNASKEDLQELRDWLDRDV